MPAFVMADTKEIRDAVLASPMESGVEYGYDRLAELLGAMATQEAR